VARKMLAHLSSALAAHSEQPQTLDFLRLKPARSLHAMVTTTKAVAILQILPQAASSMLDNLLGANRNTLRTLSISKADMQATMLIRTTTAHTTPHT
jgi:hypothetical protein